MGVAGLSRFTSPLTCEAQDAGGIFTILFFCNSIVYTCFMSISWRGCGPTALSFAKPVGSDRLGLIRNLIRLESSSLARVFKRWPRF